MAGIDDIQLLLDDHIIKAQTMKGSPFIKPFEEEMNAWEAKLITMQAIIDNWLKVRNATRHIICRLSFCHCVCVGARACYLSLCGGDQ